MLLIAAIMTFILGCAHSWLGERKLIRPILAMEGLPVILGSLRNTKATLWVSWHMVTLFMWGISTIMAYRHFTSGPVDQIFLWGVSVLFAIFGIAAIILSGGAHKSWIVFFPVSAIAGYAAFNSGLI